MTARIKIDQVGLPAGVAGVARTDGLDTGALVTLENVDPHGETTFHLMWGPTDDTTAEASLAATGDPDIWTFSPTAGCYGSYIIELRENGIAIERRIFGVRTPANGLLIPALNERGSRHASWANDGADQIELSENNAVDFNDADLNALPYAGWWRALVELYRAFENGLNFPSNLVVSGNQSIRATGDLLLHGEGGLSIYAGATPVPGVSDTDIVVNTPLGGVAIKAGGATITNVGALDLYFSSVGGGVGLHAGANAAVTGPATDDIVANADGGVFIKSGVVSGGEVIDANASDMNVLAPSGGIGVEAGFPTATNVGSGDVLANATSGIRLHAGATQQASATGLQLSTDFDLEFDVEDDALWNILGGFAIACGGLANPTPIDGRAIWHLTNGFVLSCDGSAGGGGGILIEAAAAVSSSPPVDGVVQINTSVAMRLTGAPFFQLAEAAASTPSNSAGQGMVWVESVAPCELRFTDDVDADWRLNVHGMAGMSAITTRTNSTTALEAATSSVPSATWRGGTCYRFSGMLLCTRGATATASFIVIDLMVAGVARASAVNIAVDVANGAVVSAWVEGYLTCLTTGSSGTAIATIRASVQNNGTVQLFHSASISTFTLNTTVANDLELRATFSAAVANLSMTWQGANIMKVR